MGHRDTAQLFIVVAESLPSGVCAITAVGASTRPDLGADDVLCALRGPYRQPNHYPDRAAAMADIGTIAASLQEKWGLPVVTDSPLCVHMPNTA